MSIPEGIETVNLRGKFHPLYGSVLLYAQQKCGLRSLEVELVQAPTAQNGNMAICLATATFAPPDGEVQVYTDIGDASPASVGNAMIPHISRMASTRAKGRALRDGCGITAALYEEMGGEAEVVDGEQKPVRSDPSDGSDRSDRSVRSVRLPPKNGGQKAGSGKFCQFEGCGVEVAPHELKESWDSFRKIYCPLHREELRKKLAARPAI